jgi:hypothetical protein
MCRGSGRNRARDIGPSAAFAPGFSIGAAGAVAYDGCVSDILFVCPECSKNLAVEATGAGCRVPCTDCGAWLTVPTTLYVFACPGCGHELHAPPGMPVESFQCPACRAQIALPDDTQRQPVPRQSSEGGTVRVKGLPRSISANPEPAAGGLAGAPAPVGVFAPRRDGTELAAFSSRTFVRRLWLTVFSVAALLLALIYLDVTFDVGLRVFDVLTPRAVRKAVPAAAAQVPAARVVEREETLPPRERNLPHVAVSPPPAGGAASPQSEPGSETTLPVVAEPAAPPPPVVAPEEATAPEAPPPAAVAEARRVYDQRMETIRRDHEGRVQEWSLGYRRDLEALCDKMQKAGNLDGWVAVRDEGERFARDPSIPESAAPNAGPELGALQAAGRERHAELLLDVSQKTLALADLYVHHLELDQQDHTRAGRFDEALRVKSAIDRAKADPAYLSAAFHMAVLASQQAGREEAAPPAGMPPEAAAVAAPPAGPTPKTGAAAPVIRMGGTGAAAKGGAFERLALRPTGAAREQDNFEVVVTRGISSNLQSRADASGDLTGSATETVVNNDIVVGLRTTRRTRRLDAATVTIAYYVRDLAPAEGKSVPRRLTVDTIELPELSDQWVYIDCTPIPTRLVSSEYKGASFTRRTFGGEVLHGVVVSISRRGGKPIYEAVAAVP